RVLDGEFAGRQVWLDLWLTQAALPMTKRDLAKLGVTAFEQLDRPLPQGIRCRVKVTLRIGDDGNQFNAVRSFDVTGIESLHDEPFAPPRAGTVELGDAAEPDGEVDTSFDPDSFESEGGQS